MRVRTEGIDQQLRDLTERVRQLRGEIAVMINHRETRPGLRRPTFHREPIDPPRVRPPSLAKNLGPKRRRR